MQAYLGIAAGLRPDGRECVVLQGIQHEDFTVRRVHKVLLNIISSLAWSFVGPVSGGLKHVTYAGIVIVVEPQTLRS